MNWKSKSLKLICERSVLPHCKIRTARTKEFSFPARSSTVYNKILSCLGGKEIRPVSISPWNAMYSDVLETHTLLNYRNILCMKTRGFGDSKLLCNTISIYIYIYIIFAYYVSLRFKWRLRTFQDVLLITKSDSVIIVWVWDRVQFFPNKTVRACHFLTSALERNKRKVWLTRSFR